MLKYLQSIHNKASQASPVGALSRFIFYNTTTYTYNQNNELKSEVLPGTTGSLISDTGSLSSGSLAGRLLYDNNANLIGNIFILKREYEYTYDYNNRPIAMSGYYVI